LFLPMMIITVLLITGSILVFKPKGKIPEDVINSTKEQHANKVNRQEAVAAVILVAVFVMFLTNKLHGIPDSALCLAATFAFFLFGVLEPKDFNAGISWDLIVFIAMALSLGAIFTETGISQWLAGIAIPALAPVAGNPWIFTFSIVTIMFLLRFIDVAFFIPTIAIITPILPAIQEAYRISPLVWVPLFVMAGNSFLMAYQNIWAMMSQSIAGDRGWNDKHISIYGTLYFVACLIALAITIPVWISAGLFR